MGARGGNAPFLDIRVLEVKMSHFTVLVVGKNYKEQLDPFHEFECTGHNDEFVQDIDDTESYRNGYNNWSEKEKKSFLEYIKDYSGRNELPYGEAPDIEGEHKYGYIVLDEKGGVVKTVDRTNPNKKWDWYELGGRWTGFFKLKAGSLGVLGKQAWCAEPAESGWVDQARKGDIDFEGMRSAAEDKARKYYQKIAKLLGGIPELQFKWKDLVKDESMTIDEKRKKYHNQPAMLLLQEVRRHSEDEDLIWVDLETLQCTEDEYAKRARENAVSTFAVLMDGKWYEQGHMGWWGHVIDEKDSHAWNAEFNKLIDSIPDDTVLSVVDCHI